MPEYIPSPIKWVADQVELYEGSGGIDGITLRDTGMPVIIVTNIGWKTGAIRKTPLMRVVDGENYILIASQGGRPKHPLWYHNLKANPKVEIRDENDNPLPIGEIGQICAKGPQNMKGYWNKDKAK